jgi:hypothetical protein
LGLAQEIVDIAIWYAAHPLACRNRGTPAPPSAPMKMAADGKMALTNRLFRVDGMAHVRQATSNIVCTQQLLGRLKSGVCAAFPWTPQGPATSVFPFAESASGGRSRQMKGSIV